MMSLVERASGPVNKWGIRRESGVLFMFMLSMMVTTALGVVCSSDAARGGGMFSPYVRENPQSLACRASTQQGRAYRSLCILQVLWLFDVPYRKVLVIGWPFANVYSVYLRPAGFVSGTKVSDLADLANRMICWKNPLVTCQAFGAGREFSCLVGQSGRIESQVRETADKPESKGIKASPTVLDNIRSRRQILPTQLVDSCLKFLRIAIQASSVSS